MQARLQLHSAFTVGAVSPHLFGGFLEHMGRSVYEGVYDPESPRADQDGFRTDVLDALRELELSMVRYPGGNFVSGYHWRDGVGPKAERPTVRDLAWQSLETNQVGTHEFLELCRRLDWEPMFAVNLGTGTAEEARDWVEYCNAETGTRYADLRREHGHEAPFGIKTWCLGNEMDGPWQLGHCPADVYARKARQAAHMMKGVDPQIVTVACGSSAPSMPTYLEWDRTVVEELGGLADFVSLHRYVGNQHDDTPNFLATSNSIDQQIEAVDACCRYATQRHRRSRRPFLCFDEWNVWYKARTRADMDGRGQFAPPLIEEVYNVEDALVVASFLMSFLRHADVVKIANIAQLVNVIAPVLTRRDDLLRQSIFYAFRMISSRKGGVSLRGELDSPRYETAVRGPATYLDAAATLDGNRLHLFLINRSLEETLTASIGFDRKLERLAGAEILTGDGPKDANSFDEKDRVVACPFDGVELSSNGVDVTLPPHSFAALSVDCRPIS